MPGRSCQVGATLRRPASKNESRFHYTQIVDDINMNPHSFVRSSSCNVP
ncbi:hypothetical protein C7S13_8447 [Burkholderia cepacia]|nr:hypothetical protein [Burkholderia cepacia]